MQLDDFLHDHQPGAVQLRFRLTHLGLGDTDIGIVAGRLRQYLFEARDCGRDFLAERLQGADCFECFDALLGARGRRAVSFVSLLGGRLLCRRQAHAGQQ